MSNFPWTHDQLQRYSVLQEFLEVFYAGRDIRVLDVGGVSPDREGKSSWLPVKKVFPGFSAAVDIAFCRERGFVKGNGICLPFKDRSFDVVTALDVLEHIEEKERESFIGEMCRVAKSSVVLCAPFKDERIEEAERRLFSQVKRLYGEEHRQLLEHRKFGLPDRGAVSEILSRHMPRGVSFAYGSLSNWLFSQTLKNYYLFGRNSARIQELIDRWLASRQQGQEFEIPCSRYFWLYSRDIKPADLEEGADAVKRKLREKKRAVFESSHMDELNKELARFQTQECVSAIAVKTGKGRHLEDCLNHLLTQQVEFGLEVCVLDIREAGKDKNGDAHEKRAKARFPGVKFFHASKKEGADNSLLRVVSGLKSDYILLVNENVLLPADTVGKLYEALRSGPELSLVSPRVVWKRYFTPVWTGRRYSLKKPAAGRIVRPLGKKNGGPQESKPSPPSWIYSECLLFRREALFERKLKSRRLGRRNIFLWEWVGKKKWGVVPVKVFKK